MEYACKELQVIEGLQTCVLWVEQVTLNDMLGITTAQAATIGLASALIIIVAAVFNKLGQIGDKSHD